VLFQPQDRMRFTLAVTPKPQSSLCSMRRRYKSSEWERNACDPNLVSGVLHLCCGFASKH
jgi:hypothetical protein